MKKILFVLVILSTIYLLPHAAAAPNAVIQNDTSWLDAAGYFHITGEVKNTGDTWLHYVIGGIRVTGTFLDANGAHIDTTDAYLQLDNLPPGEVGPFDLLEFNTTRSAQIRSYTLTLAYEPTAALTVKLNVQNASSSRDILGGFVVTGQVQNQGDALSKFTKVVGSFYDAQGKVVATAYTFTNPTDLPPGTTHPFRLTLVYVSQANQVSRYTIVSESQVYTSIPELTWPVIALAAALSLGSVKLRRKRAGN